ncbi:MAG: tripartite tricarboxylate transporter substrate binding protein [Burkholderiales bacterium]|nr:tripartite tricarboxylate transporter substrate binding protein [Burkholderiales bacterium]
MPHAAAAMLALLGTFGPPASAAQGAAYPDRPLRLIVPFPPGGGNDILARSVGQRLTEVIGQPVVVDNRGGAGGEIGATIAASAPADGYTLFLGSLGNLAHNPALKPRLRYDPVRDFAAVTLLATSAFILAVHPALPAKSVKDLVALAKAQPGKLNYASAGAGSSLHMTAELFKHATATDIVHVPYKGTGAALTDLVAGRVQMIFSTMPPALPHVRSGKLRALATSGAKRAAAAPDVPTVAEAGVQGFEVLNWQGIVAPVRTPAGIVRKLNHDLLATLRLPAMGEALSHQGLEPAGGAPGAFAALIRAEIAKYRNLVRLAGIRAD